MPWKKIVWAATIFLTLLVFVLVPIVINLTTTCEFTCNSSRKCILATSVCDGKKDCYDGSDESNCGCPEDMYKCKNDNTTCFWRAFWCDGEQDCLDGSDEEDCVTLDNGKLVSKHFICDTNKDTSDGTVKTASTKGW